MKGKKTPPLKMEFAPRGSSLTQTGWSQGVGPMMKVTTSASAKSEPEPEAAEASVAEPEATSQTPVQDIAPDSGPDSGPDLGPDSGHVWVADKIETLTDSADAAPASATRSLFISGAPTPPRAGSKKAKKPTKAKSKGGWTFVFASLISALWIGSLVAFVLGFQSRIGPFDFDPFIISIFSLIALGPIGFVFFAAHALNQGARLGDETRRTQTLADHMITPAAIAIGDTGVLLTGIRAEIDAATAAAKLAREEMGVLGRVLADETKRLVEAAANSAKTAGEIGTALGQERQALTAMTKTLDDQLARINEAVSRQARMVIDAAEVADAQIRGAETALATRTSDLSAAANEAAATARSAGEDIGKQVERLKDAGVNFNQQVKVVQDDLAKQVTMLNETASSLRAEHEQLDNALITRRGQLSDLISQSRDSAIAVDQTAREAALQIERMSQISKERADELNDAARSHRSALASAAIESLGVITDASARHKELLVQQTQELVEAMNLAAAQAQNGAQAQIAAARGHLEKMSEAAFGAGQQAEAMFTARLADARTLIEQSVRLAEEAGARSAEQLSRNLGSTRDAVNQFADLLADFEHRIGALPNEAARQAQFASERLAEGVASGIAYIANAAKNAAEETLAVDAQFQDRVRRNYQALGEAVRELEQVASVTKATIAAQVAAKGAAAQAYLEPSTSVQRPVPPLPAPSEPARSETERQRLRLTPTEGDSELSSVFDQTNPRKAASKDDLVSWKDLLTAIDDKPMDDDQLADLMIQEARGMQLDTQSILPRPRIDEIAAAINGGDLRGARNRVKRMAGPAVQQLARRMASNPALTAKVGRFVSRQTAVLAGAASRDRDGFLTATLLANEQGRIFLLMDAALSELG